MGHTGVRCGGMGGVEWVIQGWVGHAGVGWGGSCRDGEGWVVGHAGWDGSCRGGVGHTGVGGVGHIGVGWVIQG